jgi:competence protein ComEA
VAAPPAVAAAAADDGESAPTGRKATSGKLNLNTATPEQLELLPGVGPAKAERIIAFRQKHGAFKRVADLRRVKGFGRKTLKKLEPFLDIKGETTLTAPSD